MKAKYLIFISPILLFLDIYCFSWIAEFLRQPSDTAVIKGVALACIFVAGNYFLIIYTIRLLKQKSK